MGLSYRLKVGERSQTKRFAKTDQFAPELLYFSACVLQDREPEPSAEEGLVDVQIIEGLQRSITSGRVVKLKLPRRKRRPTLRQAIRRPGVAREPKLVEASSASQ
jgi:glucose-fructose oxidoreductase